MVPVTWVRFPLDAPSFLGGIAQRFSSTRLLIEGSWVQIPVPPPSLFHETHRVCGRTVNPCELGSSPSRGAIILGGFSAHLSIETWPSGLRRLPAKKELGVSLVEGSNPSVSAN